VELLLGGFQLGFQVCDVALQLSGAGCPGGRGRRGLVPPGVLVGALAAVLSFHGR
jgi:hypothetical protein